jgi:hypothetical protein
MGSSSPAIRAYRSGAEWASHLASAPPRGSAQATRELVRMALILALRIRPRLLLVVMPASGRGSRQNGSARKCDLRSDNLGDPSTHCVRRPLSMRYPGSHAVTTPWAMVSQATGRVQPLRCNEPMTK